MCRIGPKKFDTPDNLPAAFKPVLDELALWLELKSDADMRPVYSQRKPEKNAGNRYGLEITFEGDA